MLTKNSVQFTAVLILLFSCWWMNDKKNFFLCIQHTLAKTSLFLRRWIFRASWTGTLKIFLMLLKKIFARCCSLFDVENFFIALKKLGTGHALLFWIIWLVFTFQSVVGYSFFNAKRLLHGFLAVMNDQRSINRADAWFFATTIVIDVELFLELALKNFWWPKYMFW